MMSILAMLSPVAAYANSSVSANATLSTEVVTGYTTFCPEPTTFVEGTSTYIVTEPTTLTISNCPCTRTHTYSTATVTVCPTSKAAPSIVGAASNTVAPIAVNKANANGISTVAAVGVAFAISQLL